MQARGNSHPQSQEITGGEILALRYDHTAPLARHVAQNNLTEFPRYTFGDVYRRDQPGRGRSCEFGQADFDFVGEYAPMIADAEILEVGPYMQHIVLSSSHPSPTAPCLLEAMGLKNYALFPR